MSVEQFPSTTAEAPLVFCIPARDEADGLACLMLAQLITKKGIGAKALRSGVLAGELLEAVESERPLAVVVMAVPPFGYMHARYLCRRLRAQFRELKVFGAILTEQDVAELRERQPAIDVDGLASSLQQALGQVISLATGCEPAGPEARGRQEERQELKQKPELRSKAVPKGETTK